MRTPEIHLISDSHNPEKQQPNINMQAVAPAATVSPELSATSSAANKATIFLELTKQQQQKQGPPPALLAWTKEVMHSDAESKDDDSSSSSYDDDDSSVSDSVDEQETAVVKALVQATFDGTLARPIVDRLVGSSKTSRNHSKRQGLWDVPAILSSRKKARLNPAQANTRDRQPNRKNPLRLSQSEPALCRLGANADVDNSKQHQDQPPPPLSTVKPDDFLRSRLESAGYTYQTLATLELQDFFLDVTAESVEAYDMPVLQAVREQNIEALQQMLSAGRTLQCSNRFGESIVHTACRRGYQDVLHFLLHKAGVSLRVVCDWGRSPLHDALWQTQPNFAVVDMILQHCPDLLYMTDKRGFTPLQYIQPDQSAQWVAYLASKSIEQLLPKHL